jgi:4'-phosphopantetheinyl transferase
MPDDADIHLNRHTALLEGEVHVWYVLTDKVTSPDLLGRYRSILSEKERARNERYMFEKDRRLGLISRALTRWTLSQYRNVDPAAWEFVENQYGRPEVVPTLPTSSLRPETKHQQASFLPVEQQPGQHAQLRFNVTHTEGMVACAATENFDIGVDAENIARDRLDCMGIAQGNFAPREIEQIQALPVQAQKGAFFEFWTLKEAYIKARGMGLSLPLDAFAFELRPGSPPCVRFEPPSDEDARAWQFAAFSPTADHRLAVAVRKGYRPDLPVILTETIPLL